MGRFHRHEDGTAHSHGAHSHGAHSHGAYSDGARDVGARDVGDHSRYATGTERVEVLERIFDENDRTAAANRAELDAAGVYALNVMSSPGAGKTTLLRETLLRLSTSTRVAVIEGDIETSIDADRLRGLARAVELVNTGDGFGGECHLDAPMVRSALVRLTLADLDMLIIENVGNLVCPAEFDVGAHARVMVFSVTEGEDKPLKYPVMFRSADVVLINKMDLLPHLDFDLGLFRRNLAAVNPLARQIELSARSGAGVDDWVAWLRERARPASELTATP